MAHLKPEKCSCKLQLKWKSQFQEIEEAQGFCAEAARASQALARAEAEIELLQQLLKEKEEQVGCLLCVIWENTSEFLKMSCLEVLALPSSPQVFPNHSVLPSPGTCPRTNWKLHCLGHLSFKGNHHLFTYTPLGPWLSLRDMRGWEEQLCGIEWELFVIETSISNRFCGKWRKLVRKLLHQTPRSLKLIN